MLPFSTEQFFDAFERYNTDLPFAAVTLSILALAGVVFGSARVARSGSVLVIVLAFLWFWAGAVDHLGYFAEVNTAAYFFGAAFILQAVLLAIAGLWKARSISRFDGTGLDSRGPFWLSTHWFSIR